MDFFGLRNSAITYLQTLAGEEWTDFNEHDPGVTILDQLCYAITDLSYRTNYDIKDLLASKPEFNGRDDSHLVSLENNSGPQRNKKETDFAPREIHRDTFYTVNEIMPSHPLTINDWRKLFIDRVSNASNVWVEVFRKDHQHPEGLYRVLVEAKNPSADEKARNEIIRHVKTVFHANRNLCEDLESVQVLEKRPVKINASIEIDEKMDSEETLASIFFNLEKFLTHPVRLYTLPEMLAKNHTIETAFNGPRLNNGFILDEDLSPRITHLYYSRLIRVILEVPGVKNVYDFSIEGADEKNKTLLLRDMEVAVLDVMPSEITGNYPVKLLKNNIPVYIENNLVKSFYQAFRLNQPKPYVPGQHQQELRAYDVKPGRDRKVADYRSVQYDFPPVYGIGEFGVADKVTDVFISENGSRKRTSSRRLGLARQLKGYLLVFDQVLANYLEQLASVPALFSIDPSVNRSYFPALKLDVPGLEPLLKKATQHQHVDGEIRIMQQAQLMTDKSSYSEALDDLVTEHDDFFRRRNHILDHLLSRFGVSMPARVFEDNNWYFTTDEELHEFILSTKTATLQYIDMVTEKRGQAPMLLRAKEISWLECYVQLRLGIVDSKTTFRLEYRDLAEPIYKHHVVTSDAPLMQEQKKRRIPSGHGMVTQEIADSENFHPYDQPEKTEDRNLFRSFSFYKKVLDKKFHIDIDMFRNGYLASNYRFGYTGNDKKEVHVIYRDPEDNAASDDRSWKIIGVFDSVSEATKGILGIASFIRFLNMETEGLHLIEHLPLRPSTANLTFETELLDASGNVMLKSKEPFSSTEEQDELMQKIIAAGRLPHSYLVASDNEKEHWAVRLMAHKGKPLGRAPVYFKNEKDARMAVDAIMHRCNELSAHNQAASFRFRTMHPDGEIPLLSFYSFRMTALMPSWSARFINPGFRQNISMLLRNYAPAHCSIAEFWMSPSEMRTFETIYKQWRKAFATNDASKERLGIQLGLMLNDYYFNT